MRDLLTPDRLLEMLEGNRRLTIRTVEAFPENELFHYRPAEPLRPFSEIVHEIYTLEETIMRGIATGEWKYAPADLPPTRQALLEACEAVRRQTRQWWPQVTTERLLTVEPDPFFGGPDQPHLERLIYALENEIHHRGQGYIYLRLLGIEPPPFWQR